MVAPTPVSAYLHSATMVKAGVYLVARMAPMFAMTGNWRLVVMVIGASTMMIGGLRALRQHDLKLLLAYGTVSQLGFMMLLLGVGEYHIAEAGLVLILAHAAFKAALFMVVGIVDHETGTRDITELHGFGSSWRLVQVVAVVSAASMAGIPPLFGFIAKEKALDGYLEHGDFAGATAVLVVIVLASILTFAYSARFVLGIFGAFGRCDRPVGVAYRTRPGRRVRRALGRARCPPRWSSASCRGCSTTSSKEPRPSLYPGVGTQSPPPLRRVQPCARAVRPRSSSRGVAAHRVRGPGGRVSSGVPASSFVRSRRVSRATSASSAASRRPPTGSPARSRTGRCRSTSRSSS